MELMETLRKRRSIRKYKPDSVPDKAVEMMREALRFAPTGQNKQAFMFYFVTDENKRFEIAEKACHQEFIKNAPLLIIAASEAGESFNTGIAMENVLLAATDKGLGSCFIGWFEKERVREILGISGNMEIPIMAAVGYSDELPAIKDKKRTDQISAII